MEFSITTLGTASALPNVSRYPSAHVVNIHGRLFLVDCGEGCQMQLRRYGFSFAKIDNIFLSHLHGDHVFGLFGLLSTMAMTGRTSKLKIFAPADFAPILEFIIKYFGNGFMYEIEHVPLTSKKPEILLDLRTSMIFAFPLKHKVPAYGFLFKEKEPSLNVHKPLVQSENLTLAEIGRLKRGENVIRDDGKVLDVKDFTYTPYQPRSLAYCSDTAPFKKMTEWINGVDLLYHEATFAECNKDLAKIHYHSTAAQAAEDALKAGVKKLVIGHYSSRYNDLNLLLQEAKSIFPETSLAIEGMKFDVELKKIQ